MASQLRRLLEVAARPKVTIQVLPAVAHPVNASGFLMADDAVWIEHAAGGSSTPRKNSFRGSHCDSIAFVPRATGLASHWRLSRGWKAYGGWRKSSYSDGNGGNCVEAASGNGGISVRGTADRDGATLNVPAAAWKRFANALE
jgi:hypothetical protein